MAGEEQGETQQGRFPGRAPVDAYGNGGFRFAGMSHRGSILLLPSAILAWPVKQAEEIDIGTLDPVLQEARDIDVFLLGTGNDPVPLDPELKKRLLELGLSPEVMPTGAAARTFNILLQENRAVAAALIAVDEAF